MRKFVKLGICGLMAAMVATGCSKKIQRELLIRRCNNAGAETQEAGLLRSSEDSVTVR